MNYRTTDMGCGFWLLVAAIVIGFIVGVSALLGWVFMLLWNFAVAPTFQLPVLDFYVAWGIWVLVSLVGSAFRHATSSSKKD